ncbi:hypothetical protein [uncultured Roseibium sp.]|uniref:hypothetical protein n=1 Tax=uncultured Roseibium sp. TaxID=1936171 RepID=UPI00261D1F6C|nr:hypothetical protein [uncultured Roseibium sp.]
MTLTTYLDWPRCLLPARHFDRGLTPQSAGGNQLSLSGRLNNGGVPGFGIWKPRFLETPVHRYRDSFIAIEGQVLGRALPIMVPYYHNGFYPKASEPEDVPFSDDATFSDGSEWLSSGTHVVVKTFAAAGTAQLTVTKIACGTIQTGHVFSIGLHQYQVRSVVDDQTDSEATFLIAPELRTDVLPRDEVDFVFPAVKCRLIDPSVLSVSWQFNQWAFPTIEFIEDTSPTIS